VRSGLSIIYLQCIEKSIIGLGLYKLFDQLPLVELSALLSLIQACYEMAFFFFSLRLSQSTGPIVSGEEIWKYLCHEKVEEI
jgi:hypothetical protein